MLRFVVPLKRFFQLFFINPFEETIMQRKFEEPKDRRAMLRIKVKSLACEARLIRQAEHHTRNEYIRAALHDHRVRDVRTEARHSSLAYGFIRGKTWEQMEPNCHEQTVYPFKKKKPGYCYQPDWKYVNKMLEKFGPKGLRVNDEGQVVVNRERALA